MCSDPDTVGGGVSIEKTSVAAGRAVEPVGAVGLPLRRPPLLEAVERGRVGDASSASADAGRHGRRRVGGRRAARLMIGLRYSGAAAPRHGDRDASRPLACRRRARSRCTSAARPSTTCRISATDGTRSSSTSSAGISRSAGSRSTTSRTSPTSTTRSSTAPTPRAGPRRRSPPSTRREWWAAMDALGVLRPTEMPHATEYVAEMVELDRRPRRPGRAYETDDGVYLDVDDGPRLRPARPPAARLAARRRAGRGRRRASGRRWTSRCGRGEARRAELGVAVGRGPARLAHRVRGHVARAAR